MTFKSGRTKEQGWRPFVIEGDKLYVPPKRFVNAKAELMHPKHQSEYQAEYEMLLTFGFMHDEIAEFERSKHPGFDVVVDYEL